MVMSAAVRLAAQDFPDRASGDVEMAIPHTNAEAPLALCQTDADLQRVLDALLLREADMLEAEQDLATQMETLEAARMDADDRIAKAQDAEARLKETMTLSQTIAEDDLSQLTLVYERMKPKSAAALFDEMDPAFSAGFLGRMKPDAAAAVLAALSPDVAYSISVILAGRNAKAGDVPMH
jgi:flagellar motility protein MotE (MotC chaperone)